MEGKVLRVHELDHKGSFRSRPGLQERRILRKKSCLSQTAEKGSQTIIRVKGKNRAFSDKGGFGPEGQEKKFGGVKPKNRMVKDKMTMGGTT